MKKIMYAIAVSSLAAAFLPTIAFGALYGDSVQSLRQKLQQEIQGQRASTTQEIMQMRAALRQMKPHRYSKT